MGRAVTIFDIENELKTITGLELLPDGKTKITFDTPLAYAHEGTAPFKGEAGLLTRNILFKTNLLGVSESDIANDVGNSGDPQRLFLNCHSAPCRPYSVHVVAAKSV